MHDLNDSYDNQRETVLLAYLSGIMDGEGCISLHKWNPQGKEKTPRYQPKVQVAMCDKQIPELLNNTFGGTLIKRARQNKNWNDSYVWTLTKKLEIEEMLNKVLPFLILKKTQCDIVLQFLEDCKTKRRGRTKVSDDEILKREDFYLRMKELNLRGVPATTNRENT